MDFFCFHRDRVGAEQLRVSMVEEHWSYMDRFDGRFIARGLTFDQEGTLSGSVHIVDLPDAAAAWAFAFEEPGYQAGASRDVLVRRWHNVLGRTMWSYAGDHRSENLYLVLGFARAPRPVSELAAPPGDLVAYGPLLSDDGRQELGVAALLAAKDRVDARGVLGGGDHVGIEVHGWEFGGRRG
ncbi:YciI family protein [Arsenicicoccus sp. UBA7492]|uniref:YciI family protein n=1 Tax=Arsenicicoccus sp. UBA7492 TaxID=1946057 RepID=UPI00257BDC8B|nr:YciI family protein [Arsenicicoccus sp. UBA7492]